MIIGKMASFDEVNNGLPFTAEDSLILKDCFHKARVPDVTKFYVTYLNKFSSPKKSSALPSAWVKDGVHLLQHEIKLVRPKYILCLGADALQAVMGGQYKISSCEGRVLEYTYDTRISETDQYGGKFQAKVLTALSPRQVLRDPASLRQLESSITRFANVVSGRTVLRDTALDHRQVDNLMDMLSVLQEIEADEEKTDSVIAVDAEWHGSHPVNAGSYVRTVQLSWKPGSALCIKLHEPGGDIADGFNSDGKINENFGKLLTAFFCGGEVEGTKFRKKRVVGHFFNSDLEWLLELGVNIQSCFACPLYDYKVTDNRKDVRNMTYLRDGFSVGETVPAWYRTKYEGGADTG
jgi:uracil-DNA glycosylase family 4